MCRGPKTLRVFFTRNFITRAVVQIQVIAISWLVWLLVSSWFSPREWVTKVIVDKGRAGLIQHVPVTIVFLDNVKQYK